MQRMCTRWAAPTAQPGSPLVSTYLKTALESTPPPQNSQKAVRRNQVGPVPRVAIQAAATPTYNAVSETALLTSWTRSCVWTSAAVQATSGPHGVGTNAATEAPMAKTTVAPTTTSRQKPLGSPARTHGSSATTRTAHTTSVTRSRTACGWPAASSSLTTSSIPSKPRSTQSRTKFA